MKRRTFIAASAVTAGLALTRAGGAAAGSSAADKPFNIGMLMFQDMTYLDFAGP